MILPNNGYLETCAAVGAGFFHHNMNLAFADARYADELERVLYNGILSGVSLKGDSYFYENPLEAGKNRTRWAWHACPCCPPMFLKIMGALPGYIYAQDQDGVYVNLFIGSKANLTVNGTKVVLRQTTRYPWDGAVRLAVDPEQEREFAVNVRLPGWCAEPRLKVNGEPIASRRDGPRLRPAQANLASRRCGRSVAADAGRAHQGPSQGRRRHRPRGPSARAHRLLPRRRGQRRTGRNLVIPRDAKLGAHHRPELLGGVTVIKGPALAVHRADWPDALYLPTDPRARRHRMRVHRHPLLRQRQPRAVRDEGLDGRDRGPGSAVTIRSQKCVVLGPTPLPAIDIA